VGLQAEKKTGFKSEQVYEEFFSYQGGRGGGQRRALDGAECRRESGGHGPGAARTRNKKHRISKLGVSCERERNRFKMSGSTERGNGKKKTEQLEPRQTY